MNKITKILVMSMILVSMTATATASTWPLIGPTVVSHYACMSPADIPESYHCYVTQAEANLAVNDYNGNINRWGHGIITQEQAIAIVVLYFNGQLS